MSTTNTLTDDILDIAEQLEAAVTLNGVLNETSIASALDVPQDDAALQIRHLVDQGAIRRYEKTRSYVLTTEACEGLRDRWARSWALAVWPADT